MGARGLSPGSREEFLEHPPTANPVRPRLGYRAATADEHEAGPVGRIPDRAVVVAGCGGNPAALALCEDVSDGGAVPARRAEPAAILDYL